MSSRLSPDDQKKTAQCVCLFGSSEYLSTARHDPGNPRHLLPQPPLPHLSFWEFAIPPFADDYVIIPLFRIIPSNKIL